VEEGVETGSQITPYYDPMLAKVVTWGQDRSEAVRKMKRALREMIVLGVKTNIPYLLAILDEAHFLAGYTTTSYLNKNMAGWQPRQDIDEDMLLAAAVFEKVVGSGSKVSGAGELPDGPESRPDPWNNLPSWRNV
jgi:acetyl/propionyl-CoA carboxylase alpha subunit